MTSYNRDSDFYGDPGKARRHLVPGLSGVKWTTEVSEEASRQASDGKNATDGQVIKTSIIKEHRIGTWNVRGILQTGKLSIVEKEMQHHKLSILGICETHQQGAGHFNTASGNTVYFSGNDSQSRNGVAIILPPHLNKYVLGYNTISDRIITLKLNTKPCTLNIVQIYAPTAQAPDDELMSFYGTLTDALKSIPNRELTIIIGDWNAKVGNITPEQHNKNVVGRYGLGKQNDRGEKLVDFGIEYKYTIMNTCFKQHPRRLYTWKSPGDRYRNQIDYILINARWMSSIRKVKTFPGADCGSDHVLLVAWMRLRLKTPKRIAPLHLKYLNPAETSLFRNTMEEKLKECNIVSTTPPNTIWEDLKKPIIATLKIIGDRRSHTKTRKMWLSDETWHTVQRRKNLLAGKVVSRSEPAYAALSKQILKECRRDKNTFLENICQEIEAHSVTYQTADLFRKVRLLSKQFKPKTWVVEDEHGIPIHEFDKILERWRSYCENLYQGQPTQSPSLYEWDGSNPEPPILRSEIEQAIKSLKNRKAPGADLISAEILKALGHNGIGVIHNLCSQIWQTCVWPVDWTTSIVMPIHKKGSTKKCENYRTLSLISHASKVLLHIVNQRLRYFLDWQIPQVQAGFVKGRGTREQILNVRQLIEKCYEFDTPVVLCFVDYSKAFDCVDWQHLWRILLELGVPKHLVSLLYSLYQNCSGMVKVNGNTSKPFCFYKGVRQGCILSPILFNIYGEFIMREVLSDWNGGVSVGGERLTNLRYADDTTLIARDENEMVALLKKLETCSNTLGLSINRAKTKVMVVDRSGKLELNGATGLEVIDDFVYLGSNISNKGSCEQEVRRRIGMAKSAMSQLSKIWKDKNISQWTKLHLVRTLVFSIFLYGAETWTLKAADRKRIDAFEMWCWRRMLNISWTEHRTNVSILNKLKIKMRLSNICLRRTLEYFGHIARKDASIEKLLVTGKIEGKRPRGRSPRRWSDQIREAVEKPVCDAIHAAGNRKNWKTIVRQIVSKGGHDPQS